MWAALVTLQRGRRFRTWQQPCRSPSPGSLRGSRLHPGCFSESFFYSLGLSASLSGSLSPSHVSPAGEWACSPCISALLSLGLQVWVSGVISPAGSLTSACARSVSLPVYVCLFLFFSPVSLTSALFLYLLRCVYVSYRFSPTISPVSHSAICLYFSVSR